MITKSKVLYVHSQTCVDLEINLPLGLIMRRQIWLSKVRDIIDSEQRKKATHCLVLLIGGKMLYSDITDSQPKSRVFADLYRDFEHLNDRFPEDTIVNLFIDGANTRLISINRYMEHLSAVDYDANQVKQLIIEDRQKTHAS